VRRQEEASVTGPRPAPAGQSAVAESLPVVALVPPVRSRAPAAMVSVAAALTFALLTIWIAGRGSSVPWADEHVHRWVISHRSPGSVTFARAVTWGGVTTVVLPALVAIGAVAARRGHDIKRSLGSGLLLFCIAGVGIYAETRINVLIGRARPPQADWAGVAGGSAFPSGHTTAATLFAALCAWALAARVPAGWPRRGVCSAAVVYAAAVGWSRIWLGVHWPTDVIGGWLFGAAWMTGSIAVILALWRRSADRRADRSNA
jgi:membrane-associated phospholipid phosphatase